MQTLREIQRDVTRSILAPNDGAALAHIANNGVAAAERLNIYRNNVAIALVRALRLAYPVVDKLVGVDFFDGVARAFIGLHPPQTACLNDYGATFADFLGLFPRAAVLAYLPDVARLEWAVNVSLNAPDAPALDMAALADLAEGDHGRVRFVRHPAVRLLSVHYPADAIWRAVLADNDGALGALTLNVELGWLLVQRKSEGVAVHRLTQDEARWTSLLFSGAALAEVAPEPDSAPFIALLADHLAHGRFAGWQQCGEGVQGHNARGGWDNRGHEGAGKASR
jgi:hypothetical protein